MLLDKFYNEFGWKENNKISKDAELFEDLRPVSREYISKCRLRINDHIPKNKKNILDFASGPIQYKEYFKFSKTYKYRHCVDFSKDAINIAKKKLGKHGKYYCDDFFKIKFKKNFFDCIISLHTLYHIKASKQKEAVNKLILIAKKDAPIIIVYSNPNTLINKIKKIFTNQKSKQLIYFYPHPLEWWNQFSNKAYIEILPWRSFASQHQKIFFPSNFIGKLLFKFIFFLETKFNKFFVRNFQYPMIILTKK
jgi:ubiquinone/menaquinone biosynthesis C-methylase UbiE